MPERTEPEVSMTIRRPALYVSKADFIETVIRPFNTRISDRLVPTIRNIYANGDTVIIFFHAEGKGVRDGTA